MKCNKMPSWLYMRSFQQTGKRYRSKEMSFQRNIVSKKYHSKEISFGHRIKNKENKVDAERRHIFLTVRVHRRKPSRYHDESTAAGQASILHRRNRAEQLRVIQVRITFILLLLVLFIWACSLFCIFTFCIVSFQVTRELVLFSLQVSPTGFTA